MLIPSFHDRRCLLPGQVVRISEEADTPYRGLLAVLGGIGDEYVTAVVYVLEEDPVVLSLPRCSVTGRPPRVSSREETDADDTPNPNQGRDSAG